MTEALPDRAAHGPRRDAGLRHSAASMRAGRHEGNLRSLAVAFAANVVVATAKLVAVSFRRARRAADTAHPFGYGGVRFV